MLHSRTPTREAPLGKALRLLGGFELLYQGLPVLLPSPCQRLVAFLALQPSMVERALVAETLWPDSTGKNARASLRTTLWRLRNEGPSLVVHTNGRLALDAGVAVDLARMKEMADLLLEPSATIPEDDVDHATFALELLPGWYDDWVLQERERCRQLSVHALEALAMRLTARGRFGEAVQAGIAATQLEPIRESAHRVLIDVYLAEGNPGEALRQFERYERLVGQALGVRPSPALLGMVEGIRQSQPAS